MRATTNKTQELTDKLLIERSRLLVQVDMLLRENMRLLKSKKDLELLMNETTL